MTILQHTTFWACSLLMGVTVLLASSAAAEGPVVHTDMRRLISQSHVEDANGEPIEPDTPLDTPLYEVHGSNPILAPDGHHVTLGEWLAIDGSMSVKCVKKGAHAVFHFTGLIPNGVYTMWFIELDENGPPSIGAGKFPSLVHQGNMIYANHVGHGTLSAISAAGDLSIRGDITDCWLDPSDVYEAHIVLNYHIDGQTYDGSPGPPETTAFQSVFVFVEGVPVP